jgi:hypothetical protein
VSRRRRRRQRPRPLSGERWRRQHLGAARDEAWRVGAGIGHGATRRTGRGEGWSTARRQMWRGSTLDGGAAVRRLGRADGALSRNERSEELCIYVGCCSVDRVDRGQSLDCLVGPLAVLERARSRASDFFKIADVCSVALTFHPSVLILLLFNFQFASNPQI